MDTIERVEGARTIQAQREQLLIAERAARTEAERAGRIKDEFLATLSYELRTPLSAIMGWTQILSSKVKDAEIAEGIEVIARNAKAQAQIIEDLLDMNRIVTGKIRLDVGPVDLAAVIDASIKAVQPAADAKKIRLTSVSASEVTIQGDGARLQQVLWNLLSNAIKFTPKGGNVRVMLRIVESHLEIAVVDDGEGISPDFVNHVFERFEQADASQTRRHGGLGLGLAIVRQLVEVHGGSVSVTSAGLGQGSTFIVNLPISAIVSPDAIADPLAAGSSFAFDGARRWRLHPAAWRASGFSSWMTRPTPGT